jgi:replicative DNA helicase
MNHLKEEMLLWKDDFQKDSEKKVYEAVMMLFESAEDIDIFNKKAIYLYLRELTGLNTKQIVAQLNKMRTKYKSFRKDWDNGEI